MDPDAPVTRPRLGWLLWVWRAAAAALAVTALVVGYRRLHRSDEQVELARYVESELPSLRGRESEVVERLARLDARPGPPPDAARALLVDDLVPRLLRLRKTASSVEARTPDVAALRASYLAWVDALVDACRSSVRAIDDPSLDAARGLKEIRARFTAADAARRRWTDLLRDTCARHHLAAP